MPPATTTSGSALAQAPGEGVEAIVDELRRMRADAGQMPYARIAERVAALRERRGVPEHERPIARSTVYDQFRLVRRRLDIDLAVEIALALGLPEQEAPQWRQRCRDALAVTSAATVVSLFDPAPPAVTPFSGRRRERARIESRLAAGGGAWISGAPGMGKTQLALACGESGRFRRRILVDLRGYRVDVPPTDPVAVQDTLLRHLGVTRSRTQTSTAAARALRQALVRAGALLILDDARDAEQVRAIVGGEPCAVIVTSRRRLTPEDIPLLSLPLDRLGEGDALALLRASAGESVDSDPEAAAELSALVGGLPLALELAAARIRAHPDWSLADHVHRVERRLEQSRLDEPLESALSLSFAELDEQDALLARLFASSAVGALDEGIAASILGVEEQDAAASLRRLAAQSLLAPEGGGRWQMHALTRAFARDRSEESDPGSLRSRAHARVDEDLVHRVWSAYAALAERAGAQPRPSRFAFTPAPVDADAAELWLASRLDILLDAALAAPAAGRGEETLIRLSEGLSWWLNISGHYREGIQLHETALRWAQENDDVSAIAAASLDLGQLLLEVQRPQDALEPLTRASRLEAEFADPGVRGVLLNMLGVALRSLGRHEEAIAHFERASAIHERLDESNRLVSCFVNLGVTLHDLGRYREELEIVDRAVDIAERTERRQMLANLLVNRAEAHLALGDAAAALRDSRRGGELSEQVGFVVGTVVADNNIGVLLLDAGDVEGARVHLDRARTTAETIGRVDMQAEIAISLVRVARERGDDDGIAQAITRAERLCRQAARPQLDAMLTAVLEESRERESVRG